MIDAKLNVSVDETHIVEEDDLLYKHYWNEDKTIVSAEINVWRVVEKIRELDKRIGELEKLCKQK